MFIKSLLQSLFGIGKDNEKNSDKGQQTFVNKNVIRDTEGTSDIWEEELSDSYEQARDLLVSSLPLSPGEETEIEDTIDQLRDNGYDDEADELQEQYDEHYLFDYDNEDEL